MLRIQIASLPLAMTCRLIVRESRANRELPHFARKYVGQGFSPAAIAANLKVRPTLKLATLDSHDARFGYIDDGNDYNGLNENNGHSDYCEL